MKRLIGFFLLFCICFSGIALALPSEQTVINDVWDEATSTLKVKAIGGIPAPTGANDGDIAFSADGAYSTSALVNWDYSTGNLGITGEITQTGDYSVTGDISQTGDYTTSGAVVAEQVTSTDDATIGDLLSYDEADWTGGNVIYVPLAGNIETYVTNATAGDTIVLASGTYTITDDIDIAKAINIVGQGIGKTTITCATASKDVFDVSASDVRIAGLSISNTGAGTNPTCINTATDLTGLVFENLNISNTGVALTYGITVFGSSATVRDCIVSTTSSSTASIGINLTNTSATGVNAVVNVYGSCVSADGTGANSTAYQIFNNNDANTITMNLYDCVGVALAGGAGDTAVYSVSSTTNASVVNAYNCTFNGADYDATQTGTNSLTLYDTTLVNNPTSGTITYGGTVVSSKVHADGVVTSTNFKKGMSIGALTIWISDGTTAEGALTGVEGDICLNGGTGAGQMAYCDQSGTNWTDM